MQANNEIGKRAIMKMNETKSRSVPQHFSTKVFSVPESVTCLPASSSSDMFNVQSLKSYYIVTALQKGPLVDAMGSHANASRLQVGIQMLLLEAKAVSMSCFTA